MYCTFCEIVARREPATIHYEDDDIIVIANRLQWVPAMLLVIPRRHMNQEEMWNSDILTRVGQVALQTGQRLCPYGFRVLSNFGHDAMQSQEHGHLHVIGGAPLGRYA